MGDWSVGYFLVNCPNFLFILKQISIFFNGKYANVILEYLVSMKIPLLHKLKTIDNI